MNHDEVGAYAAERYLLDEMPEPERDAFEVHYFDCMVCASDVRSAYGLRDSVRMIAKCEDEVASRRAARAWKRIQAPLATAATVAMMFTGWWQYVARPQYVDQIAAAKAPYVGGILYTLEGQRSDTPTLVKSASGAKFKVDDILSDLGPAPFTFRFVDARGRMHGGAFIMSAAQANDFSVEVPPGGFQPGDYSLRVSDAKGKVIKDYPFIVQ